MKRVDLTGMRFSRLLVSARLGSKSGKLHWLCVCDCGKSTSVPTDSLKSGKTGSCGCRKKESAIENCAAHGIKPTHGMTGTPTHSTWMSMHGRCNGTSNRGEYKKDGVVVCERWGKFENFVADMGLRPDGTTLDRIDVFSGYSKENCRWATSKQQQRNKRNTRYLIIDGIRRPLMDVADEIGVKKSAAQYFFSTYKKMCEVYGDIQIAEPREME